VQKFLWSVAVIGWSRGRLGGGAHAHDRTPSILRFDLTMKRYRRCDKPKWWGQHQTLSSRAPSV